MNGARLGELISQSLIRNALIKVRLIRHSSGRVNGTMPLDTSRSSTSRAGRIKVLLPPNAHHPTPTFVRPLWTGTEFLNRHPTRRTSFALGAKTAPQPLTPVRNSEICKIKAVQTDLLPKRCSHGRKTTKENTDLHVVV